MLVSFYDADYKGLCPPTSHMQTLKAHARLLLIFKLERSMHFYLLSPDFTCPCPLPSYTYCTKCIACIHCIYISTASITSLMHCLHWQLVPTPLRCIAAWSSSTISLPSTPSHLKPLVQVVRMARFRPIWRHGKENVKPKGRVLSCNLWSHMNLKMRSAMWSKSCGEKEKWYSLKCDKNTSRQRDGDR